MRERENTKKNCGWLINAPAQITGRDKIFLACATYHGLPGTRGGYKLGDRIEGLYRLRLERIPTKEQNALSLLAPYSGIIAPHREHSERIWHRNSRDAVILDIVHIHRHPFHRVHVPSSSVHQSGTRIRDRRKTSPVWERKHRLGDCPSIQVDAVPPSSKRTVCSGGTKDHHRLLVSREGGWEDGLGRTITQFSPSGGVAVPMFRKVEVVELAHGVHLGWDIRGETAEDVQPGRSPGKSGTKDHHWTGRCYSLCIDCVLLCWEDDCGNREECACEEAFVVELLLCCGHKADCVAEKADSGYEQVVGGVSDEERENAEGWR